MDFSEYQKAALATDQQPGDSSLAKVIPLLGLAGETGSLLTEYKKQLRDGAAYKVFNEAIGEEIGDALWYLSNVASKAGLDLGQIAEENLRKTKERWLSGPDYKGSHPRFFDEPFDPSEQLPRRFELEIVQICQGDSTRVVVSLGERKLGDTLTDNSYEDDGYRFHDVFHLAFATILGWSPVARKLFSCKRKSKKKIDEVEDGGRAQVFDEAIAALAFDYAKTHSFLEGIERLDFSLLKTIRSIVANLEVRVRTSGEWEAAILEGFRVWRLVRANAGGIVIGDLSNRSIQYRQK